MFLQSYSILFTDNAVILNLQRLRSAQVLQHPLTYLLGNTETSSE